MRKISFNGLNKEPKSKKGWQEWNRKYALAFFYDQLDRVIHSASKRHYVMSLLKNWEKRFRVDCAVTPPEPYCYPSGNLVEDQINFVTQYVACAILDGTSNKHIKKIEHFLSMQCVTHIGDRYELRFIGGYPLDVYAKVDSLKDIDIADVFFITEFEGMDIYRPKMEKWTKRIAKRFTDELKEDVLFDFPDAEVIVDANPASRVALEISIEVDESSLLLKRLQCMPTKFTQRLTSGRK